MRIRAHVDFSYDDSGERMRNRLNWQRLCVTMTMQQLDPPLPVHVLDKGPGYAFAVIDYGQEHNLIWVTAINETGEIWCAPNPRVRMQANWTMGRKKPPAIAARENGDCSGSTEPLQAETFEKPN